MADLFVVERERRWTRHRASMKMHVLPFVVPLVPHAAFLTLLGMRYALSEDQNEKNVYDSTILELNYIYFTRHERIVLENCNTISNTEKIIECNTYATM